MSKTALNHIITLLLILIYIVPAGAKAELAEIDTPDSVWAEYTTNDRITIHWQPFEAPADEIDIEYYAPAIHSEWQHSVNKYLHLHNIPVDPTTGSYSIDGGRKDKHELEWKLRMRVGSWVSEVVTLTPGPVLSSVTESQKIWFGWWDSHKVGEEARNQFANVNVVPAPGADWIRDGLEYSDRVIPIIGGFHGDMTDNQIRRRASNFNSVFEEYSDKILYVIIQDEPLSGKGLTTRQLELALSAAKQAEGVKFGFTFTRATVQRADRELPENIDVVEVQGYPFFDIGLKGYPQIQTKQEFMADWNNLLGKIKQKAPGIPIMITGQAFHFGGGKWRKPPLESPLWYGELASRDPDVMGVLWYIWHDKGGAVGLNRMPDVYEYVKKAHGIYAR